MADRRLIPSVLDLIVERLGQSARPTVSQREADAIDGAERKALKMARILRETARCQHVPRPETMPAGPDLWVVEMPDGALFGVGEDDDFVEPQPLDASSVCQYEVDVPVLLGAIACANRLEPLDRITTPDLLSIGLCVRRGLRAPVFLLTDPYGEDPARLRGLRATLVTNRILEDEQPVIFVAPTATLDATVCRGLALGEHIGFQRLRGHLDSSLLLDLTPALDALAPMYWPRRLDDHEFVYERVTLDLAEETGRHIARFNGALHAGFQRSDVQFARLLRLAAARLVDKDDGWVTFAELQIKPGEDAPSTLRSALAATPIATVPAQEQGKLVRTWWGESRARLALLPHHIRIDPSICRFQSLEETRMGVSDAAAPVREKPRTRRPSAESAKGIATAKSLVRETIELLRREGLLTT